MTVTLQCGRRGYTVVEMMVTIVIVTVLAATVGTFVVKLLTFQESEREDAYIREKLTDICAAYADFLSVGSAVGSNGLGMAVAYRQETGGVSFETGIVSHVTSLIASLNTNNWTVGLNAYGLESGSNVLKLARTASGNAPLIAMRGDMPDIVSCTFSPLNALTLETAALGNLRVEARYQARNRDGEYETRTTSVERIVRLWNHE